MSTNFMTIHKPGLGHATSYQVSGIPFVTSSIVAPISSSTPVQISFPYVTKKVTILNTGGEHLRVGFSALGTKGTNYVLIHEHATPAPSLFNSIELEVKCTSIFLLSDHGSNQTTASIAAELTNIEAVELTNNWSGSVGVG